MNILKTTVTGLAALSFTGCAVIDQAKEPYQRPGLPEKSAWSAEATQQDQQDTQVSPESVIDPEWWRAFGDATLSELVETAINGNHDLLMAASRVKEAEARLKADSADRLPVVNLGLDGSYRRQYGDIPVSGEKSYGLGGQLNWEMDLWGKLAKQSRASAAGVKATEANWRAVWLKVASTVARSYFRLRRYDEEIQLHQSSIDFASDSLRMFNARVAAGFATQLEVSSQEAELNRLQREMMELQHQRLKMENRLATLVGRAAGTHPLSVSRLRGIVQPRYVPLGIPSELIARRPDVIAAEYGVLQAHELLGKARLEKLPTFSIGATASGSSSVFGRMLDSWTLGLTSGIRLPVFNPRIDANIDYRQAQSQQSIDAYKRTVLVAYEEVENALAGLRSRKQQQALLEQQVRQLEGVATQRQGQLRQGLISQLELFEAERSRVAAARARLVNYELLLLDTVTLYETLGGGWQHHQVRVDS